MLGFRVWDIEKKSMIGLGNRQKVFDDMDEIFDSPFCVDHTGRLNYISCAYYLGDMQIVDQEKYIPMQSTGYYDRSNEEIFEGDILQITLNDKTVNITVTDVTEFLIDCGEWEHVLRQDNVDGHFQDHIKIIGNIHEHPKLLEKSK